MNARPPVWIGPRGCAALGVTALVASILAAVLPWTAIVVATAAIALAAFAADAAAIARAPDFARRVPGRLELARPTAFEYRVTNRASVALRFAIYEAPAARLEVGFAPARGTVAAGAHVEVRIPVMPRERGRTQTGVGFAWFESPLGLIRRRVRVGGLQPLRVRPDLALLERGDLARHSRLIDAGLRRGRRRGAASRWWRNMRSSAASKSSSPSMPGA